MGYKQAIESAYSRFRDRYNRGVTTLRQGIPMVKQIVDRGNQIANEVVKFKPQYQPNVSSAYNKANEYLDQANRVQKSLERIGGFL
jgi:hypothetical protein